MNNTSVGNISQWYQGVSYDGSQLLITVWDNNTCWIQTRDSSLDSFGKPIICQGTSPTNIEAS